MNLFLARLVQLEARCFSHFGGHRRSHRPSMESLVASAGISYSPSSFAPLSIFSPKRTSLYIRLPFLRISSKNGDGHDFPADTEDTALVPLPKNHSSLCRLPKDEAMDLVLSAAIGRGWTTGSGMEGPAAPESDSWDRTVATFPWSLFTKSPRRRMRVAFTCNVCGQRTTRAINPHAYTDGTVFVQCCGCNVFHKLVDNLNLFHEMKCYVNPTFRYKGDVSFNFLDGDDDDWNIFPIM